MTDQNQDGHDDATGEFVEGNHEAAKAPKAEEANPLATIAALDDAVEALVAAAAAAAAVDPSKATYTVHGYRLTLGHGQLISAVAA